MGSYNYLYPVPAVLIGSIVNGKVNYEMLGNCGIISGSKKDKLKLKNFQEN